MMPKVLRRAIWFLVVVVSDDIDREELTIFRGMSIKN
jgi:hypothetical protein